MYQNYKPFLDRMIHLYEGGYGWDKGDPGGPTKYGITCYDLAEYLHQPMTSMAAWAPKVKAMTLETAEAIYWGKYALGIRFNGLPSGVDVTMMDYSVNSGLGRPIHVASAILGLKPRGVMDNELARALQQVDPKKFCEAMDNERLAFMRRLPTWPRFHGGWVARVLDLRHYSDGLIAKPLIPPPPVDTSVTPPVIQPMPKAIHAPDPAMPKQVGTGVGSAVATAVAGHVGGVPMSYLVVLVLGAVVAGVAYYYYKKYAAQVANTVVTDIQKVVPGATGTSK